MSSCSATASTPEQEETVFQGGLFLSADEVAIVKALQELAFEDWSIGKTIARRAGLQYGGGFRVLLVNLIARKVVEKNPAGTGYRLHPDCRKD